jgi:aryl-alcohol dehydrogenase (NADP+)
MTDDESKIAKSRFTLFQGYMKRYQQSIAREAVSEYVQIASNHGLTPTQLALAWCSSRWFVTSTIIGATTLDQLKENINSFDVTLSEEILHDIAGVYRKYRDPSFN